MKPFKKIQTGEYDTSVIQDNVEQSINAIINGSIVDVSLLSGIALTAGQDNAVSHKLQRNLRFWILSGINANANVWEVSKDSTFLTLRCSSNCTVNLWVG